MSSETKLSSKKQRLLAALKKKRKKVAMVAKPPLERQPREPGKRFPMSRSQHQLFLKYLQDPKARGQNIGNLFRMKGNLDRAAMDAAVRDLVSYHEILRTAFRSDGEDCYLEILEDGPEVLVWHDVRDQDAAGVKTLRVAEENRAFALEDGSSTKVFVFILGDDTYDVCIVQHHIVSDMWTLKLLIGQLVAAYNARLAGTPLVFPEDAPQFVDFSSWEQSWLTGTFYEQQMKYWVNKLADVPVLELPMSYPDSMQTEREAEGYPFYIEKDDIEALKALSREENASMFMTMLLCYQTVLARFSGQNDFAIGTALTNRSLSVLENMAGYFVNMVVLRNPLIADVTVLEQLKSLKKTVLKAFNECNLPLMELVQNLKIPFNPLRPPLFQTNFLFQNMDSVNIGQDDSIVDSETPDMGSFSGLTVVPGEQMVETTHFDLVFQVKDFGDRMLCMLLYPKALMHRDTVEGIASGIQRVVHQIGKAGQETVWDLTLEDEAARNATWNALQAQDHHKIAAQVLETRGYKLSESDLLGVKALVLDERKAPVVTGAYGSLYLAGLDEESLRAETDGINGEFISHSFGSSVEGKLFKTGEKALLKSDGSVELAGVNDAPYLAGALEGDPPQGVDEIAVAEIVRDLLKLQKLPSRDSNFFHIGGHSLTASRVMARVGQHFSRTLNLSLLFQHPTVAELVRAIGENSDNTEALDQGRNLREGVDRLVLSFNQERFWNLMQALGPSKYYGIPFLTEFVGNLNVEHLEAAILNMMSRHEVLRTRFEVFDGVPYQKIEETPERILEHQDLSHFEEDELNEFLRDELEEDASRPFDLATGPILRATLFKLAPKRYVLNLCIHHVAFDGSSLGILVKEILVAYGQLSQGIKPELEPLAAQYADFALWQKARFSGSYREKLLGFWKGYLDGIPENLGLPTDYPRPEKPSYRGGDYRFKVPQVLLTRLEHFAQDRNLTMFMLSQMLWAILLSRYSGNRDVCIGTPISGRTHADYHDLIGFFINNVVVRNKINPSATLSSLCEQSREQVLAAFEHEEMPIAVLVDELLPKKRVDIAPLFQVLLAVQNFDSGEEHIPMLGDLQMRPLEEFSFILARYDLSIVQVGRHDGLEISITYALDIFNETRMKKIGADFLDLVTRILDASDSLIVEDLLASE